MGVHAFNQAHLCECSILHVLHYNAELFHLLAVDCPTFLVSIVQLHMVSMHEGIDVSEGTQDSMIIGTKPLAISKPTGGYL